MADINAVVHQRLAQAAGEWDVIAPTFPATPPAPFHRRYPSLEAGVRALVAAGFLPNPAASISVVFAPEHDTARFVQYAGPGGAAAMLVRVLPGRDPTVGE